AAVAPHGSHPARHAGGGARRAPRDGRSVAGLADHRQPAPRRASLAGGDVAPAAAAATRRARADNLAKRPGGPMRGLSELRNSEQELYQFQMRVGIAGVVVLVAFALLAARFLYLQVLQHDVYRAKAEDNRISVVPVTPNRGLIVDRNGVVIARNYSGYTLEIFPRRVRNLERTIDELSEFVDITARDRARFRKLLQETRNAENLPIKNRLSDEEVAKFAANRFR